MKKINKTMGVKELTIAGEIYDAGNANEFKTGDWRSMKPIWIKEKCKQCLLCYPVCPDSAVIVDKETGLLTGIDYEHCKGCGVCTKTCPFQAYDFVEEDK